MPNWCRNEIRFNLTDFRLANVRLEEVLDFVKESIPNFERRSIVEDLLDDKRGVKPWERNVLNRNLFDFHNLMPYPDEYRARDEDSTNLSREAMIAKYGNDMDGYNSGGYEWCIKHWGSKWNAKDVVWVPQQKTFYFDTAWSPVFRIVSELHKRFPMLHICFEYYERGMAVMGGCEYIPEADWDPCDYFVKEVGSAEQLRNTYERIRALNGDGEKWEAGRAYNPWSMDYLGFKGG